MFVQLMLTDSGSLRRQWRHHEI